VSEAGRPPRPRLVAVRSGETAEDSAPSARPFRRWLLPLLLGIALALCAAALATEARRAAALEARLTATQAELSRAQSRLAAWEAWRGALRGHAERLQSELGALAAALATDPGEAPPAR
jgi:hypothetical protein